MRFAARSGGWRQSISQRWGEQVKAGSVSALTLKKRRGVMKMLTGRYADYAMEIPQAKLVELRDEIIDTPAWADSVIEGIRGMYRWATERRLCAVNPAIGVVARIDRGKGRAVDGDRSAKIPRSSPARHNCTPGADPVHVHRLQDLGRDTARPGP